jgi:hypothetical protein
MKKRGYKSQKGILKTQNELPVFSKKMNEYQQIVFIKIRQKI